MAMVPWVLWAVLVTPTLCEVCSLVTRGTDHWGLLGRCILHWLQKAIPSCQRRRVGQIQLQTWPLPLPKADGSPEESGSSLTLTFPSIRKSSCFARHWHFLSNIIWGLGLRYYHSATLHPTQGPMVCPGMYSGLMCSSSLDCPCYLIPPFLTA